MPLANTVAILLMQRAATAVVIPRQGLAADLQPAQILQGS